MRKLFQLFLALCAATATAQTQGQGFVIKGRLPGIKDGVSISLISDENRQAGVIARTKARDGSFELRGRVQHPELCTLTTSNLELRETQKVKDSIHWTYTPVFVDNVEMLMQAPAYTDVPLDAPLSDKFSITGGEVQTDFNDYNRMLHAATAGREYSSERIDSLGWKFISTHPESVMSAYLANKFLQRGYNLTEAQIEMLDRSITAVPADTARFNLFRRNMKYARLTTIGAPLVDLELADPAGRVVRLKDIVPKGKFVLIDFWASWCGICIAAMPEVRALQERFGPQLAVIGVSCDKKNDAWHRAMQKHPEPWPQYVLTPRGYADFFNKYHVGDGVPYYTLIAPDGRVMKAPGSPAEIARALEFYNK